MPFPAKRPPGSPPAEKKPRKFTKEGTLIGCDRILGPEVIEVEGQQVEIQIQVSRRSKSQLARLAAQAMSRPDGVKAIQGGLFRVVARPAQGSDGD